MKPWVTYHFFKQVYDAPLDGISSEHINAVATSHGSVLFATDNSAIWSLDAIGQGLTSTLIEPAAPITHLIAAGYSPDVLFIQCHQERNDEGQVTKSTYEAHIRDYRALEGQDIFKFEIPGGDLKHIAGSPKLTRVVYSTDGTSLIMATRSAGKISTKSLDDPEGEITAIYCTNDEHEAKHVYVTTKDRILVYRLNKKVWELVELEHQGCQAGLSALGENGRLLVTRPNSVAIYTRERLQQIIDIDSTPRMVTWFRNYLVAAYKKAGQTSLRLYDVDTHCVFHSGKGGDSVRFIVNEWGNLILIMNDNSMQVQQERDTDYKVGQLCGRHQAFNVALDLAKSTNMKPQAIADIHRRIGDSNYEHQNYQEAIKDYIEAIGYLEASYVIDKFLQPQHSEHLCTYLEALHQKGAAEELHTSLLFNTYCKLHKTESINERVKTAIAQAPTVIESHYDIKPPFSIESAARVLGRSGFREQALQLTRAYHIHKMTLRFLMKDERYDEIFEAMRNSPADVCEYAVPKYGTDLLENFKGNAKKQTAFADWVVSICVNPIPKTEDTRETRVCDPELFAAVFTSEQSVFFHFLTELIKLRQGDVCQKLWNNAVQTSIVVDIKQLPILVGNPNARYSQEQALIAIKEETFEMEGDLKDPEKAGELPEIQARLKLLHQSLAMLYEKRGLYYEILSESPPEGILAVCEKYGNLMPSLWTDGLEMIIKSKKIDLIPPMIAKISEKKTLPLIDLISILGGSSSMLFGFISEYTITQLVEMASHVTDMQAEVNDLETSIAEQEDKISHMEKDYFNVKPNAKCTMCNMTLETPCAHFMCGHSFHEHCLGERAEYCPMCSENYEAVATEKLTMNTEARNMAPLLQQMIDTEGEGFSLLESVLEGSCFSPDLNEPTDADIEYFISRLTETIE